ncbi:MAG: RAMP superfamily CRISPR-associated protein [Pseudonocardiaceae bacterium]
MTAEVPGLRNGVPFPVSVCFDSDWMCATGTARHGAVDRQIQRDAQGFPMLGGKTLMAMLRDAAETVADGLDSGGPPSGGPPLWRHWVEALFGSQPAHQDPRTAPPTPPRPAALVARPLHLPAPVRAAVLAREEDAELVTAALVTRRPGVRIDRDTGVAADDMLRIEERARAGLTVTADWTVRLGDDGPVPWAAELLLLAAARLVTEVGGKRRRGAGRCTVHIGVPGHTDVPGPTAGQRLDTLLDRDDQPGSPPDVPHQATGGRLGAAVAGEVLQLRHELQITALTPLIVIRGVRGNAVLTEPYVPGTMLLPLVHRALGDRAGELISAARVVVTDATPQLDDQRALPVPRALHADKDDPTGKLLNRIHPDAPEQRRRKPVGGYHVGTADGLLIGDPVLIERAHAVIDDEQQRPTEGSGGLYVNQAMAAGTVLRAQVWIPPGVPLDVDALSDEHSLGRSRKDDYGRVRIDVVDPAPADEVDRRVATVQRSGEVLVWLQSDVVLRGEQGQPEPSAARLAQVLGAALGVELRTPEDSRPAAFIDTRRIESWHTRWGLPRPSLLALRAGSVFRFAIQGTVDPDRWQSVESNGIGERRAEGFGRVMLQPPVLEPVWWEQDRTPREPAEPKPDAEPLGEADHTMLDDLVGHAWRQELRRVAVARAQSAEARAALVPPGATAAQLGALRVLADRLLADRDTTAAQQWLQAPRRKEWKVVRRMITSEPGQADALWEWLEITPPADVAERVRLDAVCWVLAETARAQVWARQAQESTEPGKEEPA